MTKHVPHLIGGKQVTTLNTPQHNIFQPATGEIIGTVNHADLNLCQQAVLTAKAAWPAWKETTPSKRAQILFKFREILTKNQAELAQIVSQEQGKTIEDAKGSIARGIEVVDYNCGLISQWQGTFSSHVSADIDCYTIREPLGVCAGVSPFNFPVMVPIWMMIPAIACGNTFILKPSEQDPSAPVRLVEMLHDAGLPAGVINVVQGDKVCVDHLLSHPDIAAWTAVASTPVAEYIYNKAIASGKRAHTFGGAKNYCVIMPDANIEQTAQAIIGAAFGSAGERCMAISVVITVGESTAERLLDKLLPSIANIRIDASDAPGADMGPLISETHRQRVIDAIDTGVREGARLLVDGRSFKHPKYPNGYYLGPCLFDQVTENMSIYQQEIFGPVLVMMHVESLDQALALINRHQYGNGTAIFTRDGYCARRFTNQVHVGMVGVNIPIPVPIANHPFGGWKRSFFGDCGMHGEESIRFYTKLKTITSKWILDENNHNAFVMPQNG